MVYYNAYTTGEDNALYTPTNQGFFHCSNNRMERTLKIGAFFLAPETFTSFRMYIFFLDQKKTVGLLDTSS